MIRMLPISTIIWKEREYRKSPTSTLAWLPQIALAVSRPRRAGFVDDVVVQQRRGVDELDNCGGRNMPLALIATCPRGQQGRQRPQTFAAAVDDVVGDLIHERDVAAQALNNQPIDAGPVLGNQVSERL